MHLEFRGAAVDRCHGRERVSGWSEWIVEGDYARPPAGGGPPPGPAGGPGGPGGLQATEEPQRTGPTGMPAPTVPAPISENCSRYIGLGGDAPCEFYRCRERNSGNACGPRGYYLAFGEKYCDRFSRTLEPKLSPAGKRWLRKARICLMEHLDRNIPFDAPCATVKASAFDSHPGCYVTSGICFLPSSDWDLILGTIDAADNDLREVLVSGISCLANWALLGIPVHSLAPGGGLRGLMERDRREAYRP
jgi:hypothetical protein